LRGGGKKIQKDEKCADSMEPGKEKLKSRITGKREKKKNRQKADYGIREMQEGGGEGVIGV